MDTTLSFDNAHVECVEECYVYIDKKEDGTPFYVGIGTSSRVRQKERNKWHSNIVKKHPGWYRTVVENSTREKCSEFEIFLIAEIGRKDKGEGPLVNLTDGGEGVLGLSHSDETKNILREKAILQFTDPAQREIQRVAKMAAWSIPENKSRWGEANGRRVRQESVRKKIGDSQRGRKQPDAVVLKRSKSLRKTFNSPELREKMKTIGKSVSERPGVNAARSAGVSSYNTSEIRLKKSKEISELVWITDGVRNFRIRPYEMVTYVGFCFGRSPMKRCA